MATFQLWLYRAVDILLPAPIDNHSANNKSKHGLAVRPRVDLRVDFATVDLDDSDTVPLEAFDPGNVVTIFDRPVLEFLTRRTTNSGLELTQLRLDIPVLLTEAHMIALTHAAFFHVQAARHFTDHDPPAGVTIAPYPGLAKGAPRPDMWSGKQVVGMRWPVTLPRTGPPRSSRASDSGTDRSFRSPMSGRAGVAASDPAPSPQRMTPRQTAPHPSATSATGPPDGDHR